MCDKFELLSKHLKENVDALITSESKVDVSLLVKILSSMDLVFYTIKI